MVNTIKCQPQLEDLFDALGNADESHKDLSLPNLESNEVSNNIDQEKEENISIETIPDSTEVLEGVETEDNGPNKQPQCVAEIYLPNSVNCSSFLYCDNGRLKDVNCPPNMWFDPNYKEERICNYPEVVCAVDQTICDCSEEYPPLPPDPLLELDITCLADNRFHLKGSSIDCGRYFICYNENVFRLECRNGFHYNPRTEMCDYPELVNCKV